MCNNISHTQTVKITSAGLCRLQVWPHLLNRCECPLGPHRDSVAGELGRTHDRTNEVISDYGIMFPYRDSVAGELGRSHDRTNEVISD